MKIGLNCNAFIRRLDIPDAKALTDTPELLGEVKNNFDSSNKSSSSVPVEEKETSDSSWDLFKYSKKPASLLKNAISESINSKLKGR